MPRNKRIPGARPKMKTYTITSISKVTADSEEYALSALGHALNHVDKADDSILVQMTVTLVEEVDE
jgi:hypothetical protein